ncbi:hypothetical protein GA0061102_1009150 [Rhizobium miluonense]|uniref:Uncharacterized protein n=1 Tax=Rhizobium miluonense TaxID=411945 RepID=A0A1C3V8K2_9HYPH|nr:hypothetical protein GA0061102_1009150 [Rhizobium miluonense]
MPRAGRTEIAVRFAGKAASEQMAAAGAGGEDHHNLACRRLLNRSNDVNRWTGGSAGSVANRTVTLAGA